MKHIFDPTFRYTPSHATDIRKTFARIKKEQEKAKQLPLPVVTPIRKVK